jgi:superkiller protein 3
MDIDEVIKGANELVLEGEIDRALALLDEALSAADSTDPQAVDLYVERGDLLGLAGKKVLALETYEEALKLFPQSAALWNKLGLLLDESGKITQAQRAYQQAVEAQPEFAMAWNNLGVCHFLKNNFQEALICFQKAVELDGSRENALINLRDCYEALGEEAKMAAIQQRIDTLDE